MKNVWCVRADFGRYAGQFIKNNYAAIGWAETQDLGSITSRDQLYPIYKATYPEDKSTIVIGQQVGQISRFLLDIAAGDIVITPDSNTEKLWHGIVEPNPSYFFVPNDPLCPYPHRRKVQWAKDPLTRSSLSVPLQNTLRSSLTVFSVSQAEEVLKAIGLGDTVQSAAVIPYDPYHVVLNQILTLDDKEFEILVGFLLEAIGFEGTEVIGKTGDGGVDATGELNVSNLAKIKLFVQAKRYKLGTKILANQVRQLRQAIPSNGQGAFITTADFQKKAFDIALEVGFPRIGLINGHQLVDLLIEHWAKIPDEFQKRLSLKSGLVIA